MGSISISCNKNQGKFQCLKQQRKLLVYMLRVAGKAISEKFILLSVASQGMYHRFVPHGYA